MSYCICLFNLRLYNNIDSSFSQLLLLHKLPIVNYNEAYNASKSTSYSSYYK